MQIFINGKSIDKAFLDNVKTILEGEGLTPNKIEDKIYISTNRLSLPIKEDILNLKDDLVMKRQQLDYLDISTGLLFDEIINI